MKTIILIVFLFLFGFYAGVDGDPESYQIQNDAVTTTTTTMTNVMTFNFTAVAGIQYWVIWSSEMHASPSAAFVKACLTLDGVVTENEQVVHPIPDISIEEGWIAAMGQDILKDLTPGQHTIRLGFSSGTEGEEVGIRRVRIVLNELGINE